MFNRAFILLFQTWLLGWHTYCLNPPLQENPEGSWYCPQCASPPGSGPAPFAPELQEPQPRPELQIDPALQMEEDSPMEIDPALRGDSVVSTVPSEPQPRNRSKASPRKSSRVMDRNGKGRALILTDEEEEEEVEVEALDEEEEMDPVPSNSRGRPPNNRRKSNARAQRRTESVPDDVEGPPPPLRPQKRMKMTIQSPSPPRQSGPGRPPKIKLRLNVKGKGREEEEGDEPGKGMFDDVLSESQRDTSKTNILNSDRDRFEKARSLAEVCRCPFPNHISDLLMIIVQDHPSAPEGDHRFVFYPRPFKWSISTPICHSPASATANTGSIIDYDQLYVSVSINTRPSCCCKI